jgi:AraC-like DNA-binding protein
MFADGHASLVVDLGATCELGSGWRSGSPIRGRVIGALRAVGDTACVARSEMIGAYLEPGAASSLFHVPAIELTDAVVDLESLWGAASVGFAEQLAASDDPTRVGQLEAALLGHLRRASALKRTVDVVALARWARAEPGAMTVHRLANAAGVSRRHLTRVFREVVGVSPKRYCRLARFQAGLGHAGVGTGVPWTRVAADLGYVDQSHMIAEFREFSSLTPELLAVGRWFHPFILEAQARRGAGVRRAADVRRPTR